MEVTKRKNWAELTTKSSAIVRQFWYGYYPKIIRKHYPIKKEAVRERDRDRQREN